jgi:pimeloyl-ACP methyl ester carboxylesterase
VSEVIDDSVKSSANTLRRAVSSMLRTDLSKELDRLHVPALIVHGGRDDIVSPNQVDLFDTIPTSEVVLMPSSRHFPFLDEAELFNNVLLRFLKQQPATGVMPQIRVREPIRLP